MKQIRLGDKALDPKLNESIQSTETLRVQILDLMDSRTGKNDTVSTVVVPKGTDYEIFFPIHDFFGSCVSNFPISKTGHLYFNNALRVLQNHWDKYTRRSGERNQAMISKLSLIAHPVESDEGA